MNVTSLAVGLSIAVWQGVPPPAESGVSVGWALSELSKAAATASGQGASLLVLLELFLGGYDRLHTSPPACALRVGASNCSIARLCLSNRK